MNKNIALLALTGILTLASCGQNNDSTTSDTTKPVVTLQASPANLPAAGGSVTLSGTATDNVGVKTFTIARNDGGAACSATVTSSGTFSCTATVAANTSTSAATYTYTATATDNAGNNTSVTSNSVTVAGITAAPTYNLTINVTGVTGSVPVTVTNASGTVVYSGNLSNGNSVPNLANGTYTVTGGTVNGMTATSQQITINGANQTATLAYVAAPVSTHNVVVTLVGQASTDISVADTNGYVIKTVTGLKSGDTIVLPDGTYNLTGKTVSGFTTNPVTVTVKGADTGTTITYTAVINPINADPMPVAADGGKILTIAQDVNGTKRNIQYVRGSILIDPKLSDNNNPDYIEVFTNSTTENLNAANRIYDSRTNTGDIKLDTTTLRQGEAQYVIVRYWKGNSNYTKSILIVPDNLGPQVPDIIPVTKLSPDQTQKYGNWANGTVTLAFQNLSTLRDNPQGTSYFASGVQRVEWYADSTDTSKNGQADIATATLIGTSYSSPYQVTFDTKTISDGAHDVYAVAYDQLGNRSVVSAQNLFVLNVANTGPKITGNSKLMWTDAGTGAVKDEYGNGGISVNYAARGDGSCKIDATGTNAGNIDLYDSINTPAGIQYISGLARITHLEYNTTIAPGGAPLPDGVKSGQISVTIDGQPLVNRLYTYDGTKLNPVSGTLPPQVTSEPPICSTLFLDTNGLDAGPHTISFDSTNAANDILGNPATGGGIQTYTVYVDNQRPGNLRFSQKPTSITATQQATLGAVADDSVSGVYGQPMFFARDTNGNAFGGRAVQLASADQTNFRFFQPTTSKLDLIATVRDYAGNVSSTTSNVAVTSPGNQLINLDNSNLFVRRQQANGQFLNFGNAVNENPVTGPVGTVHSLDILNTGTLNINGVNSPITPFADANVLSANFYKEVLVGNPLSRIGKGTNDLMVDDLNVQGDQNHAPLFLISSTESAPYASVTPFEGGLYSYHAATIDKNGWASEVIRNIQY